MADNPFTKYNEAEYKQYAIAWLKDLKYLDYELIDEEARVNANEKYKEEIADKENQKANEKKDEALHQIDEDLKAAKIDCTDGMLEKILHEDEDSQKLMAQPKYHEIFGPFEQTIEEFTTKYQSEMKSLHKEKTRTIIYCDKVLRDAEREAEKESIKLIEAFKSKRKQQFRKIESLDENADLE